MPVYQHDFNDRNLNNLHTSMELVDGIPHLRVTLGADNITVTGSVNVATDIRVNNTDNQSIPVHGTVALDSASLTALENTTVTVSGTPTVTLSGTPAVTISGTPSVDIHNIPTVDLRTVPELEVKNDTGNPLAISKNTSTNSPTNRIYVSQETDLVLADSNYYFNVARGLIPGHVILTRNGYNPSVSQDVETSIWVEGGIYPHGTWTTAQKLYVISTSAADTGQSITIEGLDSNYNLQSETITTSGLTAVATQYNYIRIHTARVTSASNNSANAGEITFRLTGGTGTVVAHMRAGFGITKLSQYTVPAGKTAYVTYGSATQFRGGAGNIGGQIRMLVRPYGGAFNMVYIAEVVNGQFRDDFTAPLVVPARADIDIRCIADGNNTAFGATYQIVLIDN